MKPKIYFVIWDWLSEKLANPCIKVQINNDIQFVRIIIVEKVVRFSIVIND